ncbi:oxidoreductase family protein [Phaeosphaeria sp. MPI-PUGE-AT-0046c]|nr:oxidoreductase family protein [Phaeosphaeria sp. MPI-PUGE-AT-0046c]
MMPRIRVALIGLSASAVTTWAGDAHLPYILSPIGRKHYELVALLNSSVAAGEASKQHFNLPSTVKAYGDSNALAQDPEIDLVVCCTRADVHYPTTAPSLRAGKTVFVEWPLAENVARAKKLVVMAKKFGADTSKCIIGLQGRIAPTTICIKEVLASGIIGSVLSSDVTCFGHLLPRDGLPESLAYFADLSVGGNAITIENGHCLDYIHSVLGEFETFNARMQIQRPKLDSLDTDGSKKGSLISTTPDLLSLHGTLKTSNGKVKVVKGATLSETFRTGPPFKGHPAVRWSINGSKGELLITIQGHYLHSHTTDPITLSHHDHATEKMVELKWDWAEWQKELPVRSRMTAELYERYAEWVEGGKGEVKEGREWPNLDDAVVRMEEFAGIFRQFDDDIAS